MLPSCFPWMGYLFVSLGNNEDVKARPKGMVEIEFLELHRCCHGGQALNSTLCCSASRGDSNPSSAAGPWQFTALTMEALGFCGAKFPGSREGKILEQTPAERGKCCEGPGCNTSLLRVSLGIKVVSGRFLDFYSFIVSFCVC